MPPQVRRLEVARAVGAEDSGPLDEWQLRLFERERELQRIDHAIARAVGGSGGLLVIEGPTGAGKTALLAAARERGAAAGMRILRARGDELERERPLGVARQLLEPLLRRLPPEGRQALTAGLPHRARTVLGAGQPLADAGSHTTDTDVEALIGWSRLALNAAVSGPLLLAIDDLPCADAASLRWLAYLVRRIDEAKLLIVAAGRAEDSRAHAGLLSEVIAEAVVLRAAPLDADSVAVMVGATLDGVCDGEFCAACHSLTGGNALLVKKLLTALADERVAPAAGEITRAREIGSRAIAPLARRRLTRVSPQAQALAQSLAVLGDGATPEHASALAGLDVPAVGVAASELSLAGLLRRDAPLSFSYPIERLAIYDELDPLRRGSAHALAAELLAGVRAPAVEIAAHLVKSPTSQQPFAPETLREAARVALGPGEAATAVACLRRALREPLASAVRADVLLELAAAEQLVDVPAAIEHLREAIALLDDDERCAQAGLQLGRTLLLGGRPQDAARALRHALALPGCERSELRETLRGELLAVTLVGRHQHWHSPGEPGPLEALEGAGIGGRILLAMTAHHDARHGRAREACVERAELVTADDRLLDEGDSPAFAFAARVLVAADRFDSAESAYDRVINRAQTRGASVQLSFGLAFRGGLRIACGALADAERDARAALRGADAGGVRTALRFSAAFLALALVELGELSAASLVVEEVSHERGDRYDMPFFTLVSARQRRLAGDAAGALELTDMAAEGFAASGQRNPALAGWRST